MSDSLVDINDNPSLCEALDRVLNKGAVIAGNVTISVAGIDLIYVDLRLLVSSVSRLKNESDC